MGDLQLAIAITRAYEGDDGPVLKGILEERVLPEAASDGNRWMASWAFWMLGRRDMAVRSLIVSLSIPDILIGRKLTTPSPLLKHLSLSHPPNKYPYRQNHTFPTTQLWSCFISSSEKRPFRRSKARPRSPRMPNGISFSVMPGCMTGWAATCLLSILSATGNSYKGHLLLKLPRKKHKMMRWIIGKCSVDEVAWLWLICPSDLLNSRLQHQSRSNQHSRNHLLQCLLNRIPIRYWTASGFDLFSFHGCME